MGILDSLKRQAQQQLRQQVQNAVQSVTASASATLRHSQVTFPSLPRTLSELQAMPEGRLQSPQHTAALTVAALCLWSENRVGGDGSSAPGRKGDDGEGRRPAPRLPGRDVASGSPSGRPGIPLVLHTIQAVPPPAFAAREARALGPSERGDGAERREPAGRAHHGWAPPAL